MKKITLLLALLISGCQTQPLVSTAPTKSESEPISATENTEKLEEINEINKNTQSIPEKSELTSSKQTSRNVFVHVSIPELPEFFMSQLPNKKIEITIETVSPKDSTNAENPEYKQTRVLDSKYYAEFTNVPTYKPLRIWTQTFFDAQVEGCVSDYKSPFLALSEQTYLDESINTFAVDAYLSNNGDLGATIEPFRNPISGSITDENNQPIPNAIVTVYSNSECISETHSARTNANGNYEMKDIPHGSAEFVITIPGQIAQSENRSVQHDTPWISYDFIYKQNEKN